MTSCFVLTTSTVEVMRPVIFTGSLRIITVQTTLTFHKGLPDDTNNQKALFHGILLICEAMCNVTILRPRVSTPPRLLDVWSHRASAC